MRAGIDKTESKSPTKEVDINCSFLVINKEEIEDKYKVVFAHAEQSKLDIISNVRFNHLGKSQ